MAALLFTAISRSRLCVGSCDFPSRSVVTTMSGIIVDRAVLYLQSQPDGFQPGDSFVSVILEISSTGFKVRLKSGKLKSIDPPTIAGKSKEESRLFTIEEEARQYFKEQVDLLRQVGFHPPSPFDKKTA